MINLPILSNHNEVIFQTYTVVKYADICKSESYFTIKQGQAIHQSTVKLSPQLGLLY